MRLSLLSSSILCAALLGAGVALASDETPVPLSELPLPVSAAIEAGWPGAELLEADLEDSLYDVEFKTADGDRMEAGVTAAGEIKKSGADDDNDEAADEEDDDDHGHEADDEADDEDSDD